MRKCFSKTTSSSLSKLLLGLFLLLTLSLAIQACGNGDGDDQAKPALVAKPCLADDTGNAEPMDQDVLQLACDNSNFAFDLYSALSDGEGNLFFSPFSISQVLAMAYAGARGETERQMAETLRYSLPQQRLHRAFKTLDSDLQSKDEISSGSRDSDEDNSRFRLNIANAVWGQEGYKFHGDFLHTLGENYGGEVRRLDFSSEPEESRVTINDWVAKETEDKIKDLFPQGSIGSATRFVLTNAIYFNAVWSYPFFLKDENKRPFHLLDGGKIEVPMMTADYDEEIFGYSDGKGFQAIELPYRRYSSVDASMVIFLPDEGDFREFENSLNSNTLEQVLREFDSDRRNLILTMPLFKYESDFLLDNTLANMGMPDAFSDASDFSGITDETSVWINAVVHKAFVSVDEEGTEAAAATGVGFLMSAREIEEPITVTIDRPFIFLIRDEPTGAILFLGRVMDPS